MKQFHIFHSNSPDIFTETEIQSRTYAGFVEADDLEGAYIKSQNFDALSWNEVNPCRSTSVGDVIQDNDDKIYMVCGIGFKELVEYQPDNFDEHHPYLEQ